MNLLLLGHYDQQHGAGGAPAAAALHPLLSLSWDAMFAFFVTVSMFVIYGVGGRAWEEGWCCGVLTPSRMVIRPPRRVPAVSLLTARAPHIPRA